jgi:hypothetical protein
MAYSSAAGGAEESRDAICDSWKSGEAPVYPAMIAQRWLSKRS